MSFQAYLDNIETKTGKTPRELLALATERGYDAPATKSAFSQSTIAPAFTPGAS